MMGKDGDTTIKSNDIEVSSSPGFFWAIIFLIIMFWGKPDLHDAIIKIAFSFGG